MEGSSVIHVHISKLYGSQILYHPGARREVLMSSITRVFLVILPRELDTAMLFEDAIGSAESRTNAFC